MKIEDKGLHWECILEDEIYRIDVETAFLAHVLNKGLDEIRLAIEDLTRVMDSK